MSAFARNFRLPPLHKRRVLTHMGLAVIGRRARGWWWLTGQTLSRDGRN